MYKYGPGNTGSVFTISIGAMQFSSAGAPTGWDIQTDANPVQGSYFYLDGGWGQNGQSIYPTVMLASADASLLQNGLPGMLASAGSWPLLATLSIMVNSTTYNYAITSVSSCSQSQLPSITSIVNDAGFVSGAPVASGSWVAIFGAGFAPAGDSRTWNPATEIVNGKFPTSLDGTSVTINGKPAAVEFIQPTQLNVQPPDDTALGPVNVVVTTAAGSSSSLTVTYSKFAPGLFGSTAPYVVAQHADGTYVTTAPPAKPGEVIILWGTGFGPASSPIAAGQIFTGSSALANTVKITIAGQPAIVDYAGVVGAGLVQINVHVPLGIGNGDAPVVATVGGVSTQTTANMIAVHS